MPSLLFHGLLAAALILQPCPEYRTPPPNADASFFAPIFEACPGFVASEGAVAWQFARALTSEDRVGEAIAALEQGLEALEVYDARTADLYTYLVYRERDYDRFDYAADVYLQTLESLDSDAVQAEVARHLIDEVAPILPPDLRRAFGMEGDDAVPRLETLPADAGARLVRFWRQADRFPATVRNERLTEHLARTAHARNRYVGEDGRLDARGQAYVRYGEPRRRTAITTETGSSFSAARMQRQMERVGVLPDLNVAPNELWIYTNVHESAHFLFIYDERQKRFRTGTASELLPRTWAGSMRRTSDFLHLMEYVYQQLSLNHADYGLLYTDVANYNMTLRSGQRGAVSMPPRSFASNAYSESLTLDYQIEQTQREVLPAEHTNVREDVERMPVEARIARFLAEDGSTRTEVYWGTTVEGLYPDRRSRRDLRRYGIEETGGDLRFLLTATALTQNDAYESIDRRVRRYNLGPFGMETGLLSPGPMILSEVDEPYRLALQWDLLAYDADGTIGPLVKFQTETLGTIEPLNGAGGRFEVSDLKPMVLTGEGIPLEIEDEARIYPFRMLGASAQIALVFEVYNLTAEDEGRYRYSVEYTVARERGGLLSRIVPGRQGGDDVSARATFEAPRAVDEAFVIIDLADWNANGPVQITLAFTDDVTGATVERRIDFDVSARLSSNRTPPPGD